MQHSTVYVYVYSQLKVHVHTYITSIYSGILVEQYYTYVHCVVAVCGGSGKCYLHSPPHTHDIETHWYALV